MTCTCAQRVGSSKCIPRCYVSGRSGVTALSVLEAALADQARWHAQHEHAVRASQRRACVPVRDDRDMCAAEAVVPVTRHHHDRR